MADYLTHERVKGIQKKVRAYVETKAATTEEAKHLDAWADRLGHAIKLVIQRAYPQGEMRVLAQYDQTNEVNGFYYAPDGKEEELLVPYYASQGGLTVAVPESPLVPLSRRIVVVVNQDTLLVKELIEYYKARLLFNCENARVVKAYMARVDGHRTVRQLVAAHPDMAQFCEAEKTPDPTAVKPDEGELLIAAFEKE